jgi:hypothetical protein
MSGHNEHQDDAATCVRHPVDQLQAAVKDKDAGEIPTELHGRYPQIA